MSGEKIVGERANSGKLGPWHACTAIEISNRQAALVQVAAVWLTTILGSLTV